MVGFSVDEALKFIEPLQEEVDNVAQIFKSSRSNRARAERLHVVRESLIQSQITLFEETITAHFEAKENMLLMYAAIGEAHQFAAKHGFRLYGSFVDGRYLFIQLPLEVGCAS